jgi:hypothetical protein
MTTAISLDYQMSPPATCRVEIQPPSCQLNDKAKMKGNQVYTNPQDVTFREYGMTVQNYNSGLQMPQMRTFLGPEYFNGGCTSLYCKDSTMCPTGSTARSCQPSSDMFDYLFTSQSDFTGNSAPPQIAGGKCVSYDSVLGWELGANGEPKWKAQSGCLVPWEIPCNGPNSFS